MNSGVLGRTAKDKKIAASVKGLKMGRVLKDLGNYAQEVNGDSNYALKRKIKLMQKVSILAASEITCAVKTSSVISGSALEYTVNRTEVAAKRRRLEAEASLPVVVTRGNNIPRYSTKPRCSDAQESLERFLGEMTQKTLDVPSRKQASRLVSPNEDHSPSNGRSFTPTEVFDNLASIKKSLRGKMMDAWIEKKLVPVKSRKAIYRMIRKANEPCQAPPATWGTVGRKALLSVEELQMAASRLRLTKGVTWGLKEVTAEVAATREAKAAKQGMKVTSVLNACSKQTNKNYMTQLVTMQGISLSTSTIQKTRAWYLKTHFPCQSLVVKYTGGTAVSGRVHSTNIRSRREKSWRVLDTNY
jgi:hypothetical protein